MILRSLSLAMRTLRQARSLCTMLKLAKYSCKNERERGEGGKEGREGEREGGERERKRERERERERGES